MASLPDSPPVHATTPASRRSWLIPAIGYALSVGCLIWVYWGFPWAEELPKLLKVHWAWVAAGVFFEVATYFVQGWRWSVLLQPVGNTGILRATRAVYVGIFLNEVLPMRPGEVVRPLLIAKWARIRLSLVFCSVVMERVIDGIWLLLFFAAAISVIDLPRRVVMGAQSLSILIAVLVAILLVLMFSRRLALSLARSGRKMRKFATFLLGFNALARPKTLLVAGILSFFYLACQVVPIYMLANGYGIELSVFAATTILVILRLGTVVPQGPGNVGVTQAVLVIGLSLFGVDKNTATGLATVLFAVITVPLVVTGFIAFLITGFRIRDIFDSSALDKGRH